MSLGIQPLCGLCQDSGRINAIDYKMLCSCPAGKELEAKARLLKWKAWHDAMATLFGYDNMLVAAMYVAATSMAGIVRKHNRSFPLLFVHGPELKGKVPFTMCIQAFWGIPTAPISAYSASATVAAVRRSLEKADMPSVVAEISSRTKQGILDLLKGTFDGSYELSNRRKSCKPIKFVPILTGNLPPIQDLSLWNRSIIVKVNRMVPPPTTWDRTLAEGLLDDLNTQQERVDACYRTTYGEVYNSLLQTCPEGPIRGLDNHVNFATPLVIMSSKIDGGHLFPKEELIRVAGKLLNENMEGMQP